MHNVVLDTNVLVSSLISTGHPFTIVNLFLNDTITLFYTDIILDEYLDVLSRKKLNISPIRATLLIHDIIRFGILVENIECELKASDEMDQIFLNAAVEAASNYGLVYLITGNEKHFPKKPFIVTPAQFMGIYLDNLTS